ncbi:MAG: aldehyde ferredoxin oxidoreductase C-terminal domain-containing protein [Acidimicrobiia bacterium]|nr:aldehyde ferredoxin oxidoreductase C-terminal domain-containing protein [Acidimicrobiia bacterium]
MASPLKPATEFEINRYHVDLSSLAVRHERVRCTDFEDVLGGIARATKLLAGVEITDSYDPQAPLVMNLGLLSGTRVMTGLRTFFHGYSPLKQAGNGRPGLMWSAGSGHFGTKLRGLGIDEVIFTGRAEQPTLLHLSADKDGGPARFEFLDASDLRGRMVNDRIQDLHRRYPDAHFASIGPAGENYETVRFASIALSTDNQLETGDAKPRYCGRGGYGGLMASKNLWAIAAEGPNPARVRGLRDVNKEINLGEGSARYRDLPNDRGGTWRNMKMMQEAQSLPEFNFAPTGTELSKPLLRPSVEAGPYVVLAESCYLCGIRCHKNVYKEVDGEAGGFHAKVDYEPLTLLSSNLGIFEPDIVFDLIHLIDELGMDSISLGVTLGYAMDHNRRTGAGTLGGLSFGDAEGVFSAVRAVAAGELPDLGQGVKRLSEQVGETAYAMHSKGVEYPAYQPHTNPGFPWALAGGHMSMRTFFLYVIERETDVDYWVDAITNRGPLILMDDITGLCKFAAITPEVEAEALRIATGLDIDGEQLRRAVANTFLRGYACERRVGFDAADYRLPAVAHEPMGASDLAHFNTPDFFGQVQRRVLAILDERATAAGFM